MFVNLDADAMPLIKSLAAMPDNKERRVVNMRRSLERHLNLLESDRITGGENVDSPEVQNPS